MEPHLRRSSSSFTQRAGQPGSPSTRGVVRKPQNELMYKANPARHSSDESP